jgi:hypothetical protein
MDMARGVMMVEVMEVMIAHDYCYNITFRLLPSDLIPGDLNHSSFEEIAPILVPLPHCQAAPGRPFWPTNGPGRGTAQNLIRA